MSVTRETAPLSSSWLADCISRHFPGGTAPDPVLLRESLEGRLTDTRKPRGKRHPLPSLVSVTIGGAAAGHGGPLAVAQAAAGWDQDVLAAHGCRVSARTGLRVPPSASMLGRLHRFLDADELEAALSASVASAAPGPAIPAAYAAHRAEEQRGKEEKRKKKVHLLAAVTHVPGLVIAQDRVAKAGKANEVTHFRPLLEPLPLDGVLITSDAMQATRDNALYLRKSKNAHYLWPVLGNQPNLNAQLSALPWETTPVAAATSELSRGRIETRTIRVLPAPGETGFEDARLAILIEGYTTYKKKGQWHTRAEAVLYITSLTAAEATPEDLLAHVRGHWRIEHAHWLRDVIWKEDKSLIRTGNGPQIWSAITNLVITLFRIHGVTTYTEETRLCAQDPRRALRLLDLTRFSPG